jgi:hypothetical protein
MSDLDRVLLFRSDVNGAAQCRFRSDVTLDYGNYTYSFGCECQINNENMDLTVVQPEVISGISARIASSSGELTFDDKYLAFESIASGNITPIITPWLFMRAIQSGYISTCGKSSDGYFAMFNDTYQGFDFSVKIYFIDERMPTRADIIWNGKRIASMSVNDFVIM